MKNIDVSNLPNDTMSEILKYSSMYSRINKKLFNLQLFYNQYSHLEITWNEFVNYFNEAHPEKFILYFTYDNNSRFKYEILGVKNCDQKFVHRLFDNNAVLNDATDFKISYDLSHVIEIRYDLNTVKNIYRRRIQCQLYNPSYSAENCYKYWMNIIVDVKKSINVLTEKYIFNYLYCDGNVNYHEFFHNTFPTIMTPLDFMDKYDLKKFTHFNNSNMSDIIGYQF